MKKHFGITCILLTVISFSLFGHYIGVIFKYPYVGALVEKKGDHYEVVEIDPNTWASKHLEIGDIIIKVDGSDPSKHEPIRLFRMLEQVDEVIVRKLDSGLPVTLDVHPIYNFELIFQVITPILVYLITLSCIYLVYKGYSEISKRSSLLLILFLLDVSLGYANAGASARGNLMANITIAPFFLLAPVLYLHFIYQFFKELNIVWFSKKWIYTAYVLVVINCILDLVTYYMKNPHIDVIVAKSFNLSSFLFHFILAYILLLIGLKKVKYKVQKHYLKMLIFFETLAFAPFILLYTLPYLLFQQVVFSPVLLSGFTLVIPFSLIYQFFATKILDIEFMLGKIKYYFLLAIIPTLIGTTFILTSDGPNPMIFAMRTYIIVNLVVVGGFYLKEVADFQFQFNRIIGKHDFQEKTFEFTNKIRNANEFHEVISKLQEVIVETLNVTQTYLVQLDQDSSIKQITPANHTIQNEYKIEIQLASTEVGYVVEVAKGFLLNIGETQKHTYILVALAPVNTPKLTRDALSWLKTLAYYTNVTIEGFLKIEQFMEHLGNIQEKEENSVWLNRVLYQIEEKQRSQLAKDLHDSVLQDLLSIKRKVELHANGLDQQKPYSFNQILKDLNSVIQMTRETCHELRPNILYDLGLHKALKKLVEQHKEGNQYNIRFTYNKIDEIELPRDVQLNIYRIIQELLNNTKKHAKAKNIILLLVKIKDKIVLHYEDDGMGADPSQLFRKKGSMGLSGIRERVKMLNGTMQIDTSIHKGFKVQIEI